MHSQLEDSAFRTEIFLLVIAELAKRIFIEIHPLGFHRKVAEKANGRIKNKKAPWKTKGLNKYGSYLLSRIVVQYHRP